MIDTGYEHNYKSVAKKCSKHGIELSEIQYVFLTHAHDDHAGFLNEFLEKHPKVKVVISDKAMPILLKGQNSFLGGCSSLLALISCKIMGLIGNGKHLFPAVDKRHVDRLIQISSQNKTEVENLLQGKILFTPGHTSDSISLKIGNSIFCGDAAMNGLPSLKRITIWIEDKTAFSNSWDILMAEKANLLYPSHGKPFYDSDLKQYKGNISKVKLLKL